MEEALREAITAIEIGTGKKPVRIELEGGAYMMKYMGVDVLMTASQYGKIYMDHHKQLVRIEE